MTPELHRQLPKLIAFYLPQYHPIPENDEWWGKGFTEWTNVTKAKPAFADHYQPHLPADLGFYDLRLPETRAAQARLAREYGIHGFCYYHYWFNGRRLLERPFAEVLAGGEPDFPFCLCWANENWTRRWDGLEQEVLVGQNYSDRDHEAHVASLAPAFHDRRYIRVDGKPLFLVYRAAHVPDPERMTDTWRRVARRLGVGELFLCNVQGHDAVPPEERGFDAAVEFHPGARPLGFPARVGGHKVYSYAAVVHRMLREARPAFPRFRCVVPSWDNAARRAEGATILHGSTPQLYQYWLEQTLAAEAAGATGAPPRTPFVFVNAWNEWAEGNHLEPDQRWGRGYLEATRRAIENVSAGQLSAVPGELARGVVGEAGVAASDDELPLALLRAAAQRSASATVELAARNAEASRAELDRLADELHYLDRVERVIRAVEAWVPPGRPFLLVDDVQLGLGPSVRGRRVIPLMERDGEYWGAPPDDAAAADELRRQFAAGTRHVAVAWPSAWYLTHYLEWATQLRARCRMAYATADVSIFVGE